MSRQTTGSPVATRSGLCLGRKSARRAWGLSFGVALVLLTASSAQAQCAAFDFYCLFGAYGQDGGYRDSQDFEPPYPAPSPGARWADPYASNPARIVDQYGNYYGRYSANPYLEDSVTNPEGRYGPNGIGQTYGYTGGYSNSPSNGYNNGYSSGYSSRNGNRDPYGLHSGNGDPYGLNSGNDYGYGYNPGGSTIYNELNRGSANGRQFYLVPSED